MRAVELIAFGAAKDVLRVNPESADVEPAPNEIVVRVHAASVNPLDCRRRVGYGRQVYKAMGAGRFPIVLGCDFSGVVVRVGPRATRFKEGDEVWGAQDPFRPGCQADYVAVKALDSAPKPAGLSHAEAASIPYAALTAWSALVVKAGLTEETAAGKSVLIHAGGGGVGTMAIQLMKAWGARVAATCSTEKVQMVRDLGADVVIDYTRDDFSAGPREFDVVLDSVGGRVADRSLRVIRPKGQLISLHSPLMPMTDKYGSRRGFAMVLAVTLVNKARAGFSGVVRKDAYFRTDGAALETIGKLIEAGRIRPVVDRVLPPEQVAEAHTLVEGGHTRGKVVLAFA